MGVKLFWDNLRYGRTLLTTAAAQYGIPSIESTSFELYKIKEIKEECTRSKNMGFTGMAAIHPNQVPVINSVFKPTEEEIQEAKFIIEESRKHHQFAMINDKVIGPPFIKMAKDLLNRAGIDFSND